jgi:hypothetical protein
MEEINPTYAFSISTAAYQLLDPAVELVKPSSPFVFPPLSALELPSPVTLDVPLAPIRSSAGSNSSGSPAPLPSSSDGDGAGLTVQTIFVGSSQPIFPPPLSGAAELGEKIRSSPPRVADF